MAERAQPKPKLASGNRLERWSLFGGIVIWTGVLVFGIGLLITLRSPRSEPPAYANIATTAPVSTVTATSTASPTHTPQIYPLGWSTATPIAQGNSPGDGLEPTPRQTRNRTNESTERAGPRLALTPQTPLPLPNPPDRLVIPRIELDSAIVPIGWHSVEQEGVSARVWEVADYVVGWHETSGYPGRIGNIVLNGHHNIKGEVFRHLVDLEPGDQVYVYAQEQPYAFEVTEKHILKEKGEPLSVRRGNAKWIEPTGDERLTMITCWPYTNNTHRLVVVAKPVSAPSTEGLQE